jgi:hypothetical protein
MNDEEFRKQFEPRDVKKSLEYPRQLFQARYAPCGRFLVACGYDATIQRWDVSGDEPRQLAALTGHEGWVQCQAMAAENSRLYSADSWGRLSGWQYDAETADPIWSVAAAHPGWIRALAVSADGQWLATGGNDTVVKIWSAADGTPVGELPHPDRVFSLLFTAGGALVSGDLKGVIREWDIASRGVRRQLAAHVLYQRDNNQECGGVRHLAFDAEGRRLVCAGQKTPGGGFATGVPCALVFDWESGQVLREMAVGGNDDGFAYDACFHPAGFVMAASCAFPGKGHVWFWRPEDEKPFFQSNKLANGRSLSLHPQGGRLAFLVSLSANGNGRMLRDGQYLGGSAKIHILDIATV